MGQKTAYAPPKMQVRGRFIEQPKKNRQTPIAVLLGSGPGARRASMQGKQAAPRVLWAQYCEDYAAAMAEVEKRAAYH